MKKEVDIHKRDEENKCKMKEYLDNKNNAKYSGSNEGECVLVKTPKTNKFSTPFKSVPYNIISKAGSQITASTGDHTITRNLSHFKKIKKELMEDTLNKDNDLDEEQLELDNEEFQNNTSDNTAQHISGDTVNQRPTRVRKSPSYLKDYVCQ